MKQKRQTITTIFVITMLMLATEVMQAQDAWVPVNSPPTGRIFTLQIVPGLGLLAGTEDGGMFLSKDNGQTWAYHALAMSTVRSFYLHSDGRIFAGKQSGASVSTDNGATWEYLGLSSNENGFGMTVNSSGHIFAAGWREGINRSTDNGATWEVVVSGMDKTDGDHIVVDATDVLYAGMYRSGLYLSTNNGDAWTLADSVFTYKTVGALEVKGSSIFAAVEYLGFYRSTDHGVTWTGSDTGFDEMTFSDMVAVSETELYVLTQKDVYHSTDAGATWVKKSPSTFNDAALSMVRTTAGRLIVGTSWNGIWISDDNGVTWSNSSDGLTNVDVETFAAGTDGRVYLSHRVPPIVATTDHGMTWQIAGTQDIIARQILITPSGALYAASYTGLYMSTDKGVTWTVDTTGMTDKNLSSVAITAAGDLFVGGSRSGCFRRLSTETSWTEVTNELLDYDISCMLAVGNKVFAGTQSDGLFVTTDNGASWTDITDKVADRWIYTMFYDETRGLFVGTHNAVSHSTDQGVTWTARLGNKHPGNSVTGIALAENGMVVSSSLYSGVLVLTDPSADWVEVNDGLYNTKIKALIRDSDGYYYAGTEGNGIFRNKKLILSAETPPVIPATYTLGQNYPNPFNPTTTIRYGIPTRGHVTVKVYNIIGVEVASLVDRVVDAGTHSVSLDGTKLHSGQYFYQLRSGTTQLTRSMLLIK